MPVVLFKNCNIDVVNIGGGYALDPCNCSSYYVVSNSGGRQDTRREVCSADQLWNFRTNRCEPRQTVLNQRRCDPAFPWNRCLPPIADTKIKHRCIVDGYYTPSSDGSSSIDNMVRPRTVESANIEMAAAAFVAGVVVTLLLVAILITFCGLSKLRLPRKLLELLDKTITIGSTVPRQGKKSTIKTTHTKQTVVTGMTQAPELYEAVDQEDESGHQRQQQSRTVVTSHSHVTTRDVVVNNQSRPARVHSKPQFAPPVPSSKPGASHTSHRSENTSYITPTNKAPIKPPIKPPNRRF